jgi:serine/threonine protein kinase
MSLAPDTKFGHFKIISQLGAGGMGEVFLAEDTRLERKVALKLLPEKFSANTEPLDRFKQEAKAASALNHPNIITVYEIGEQDGANFIATEFIDGQTLRERMKSRLTFDEILSITVQTAEALSAAHQAGIVHRDIKPENIMVRPDGYVKVLDFGLAKLTNKSKAEADSDSEEETAKLVKTNPGVVMGTAAYMSPEQARGKAVDARSDIFSFGILVYEILAGQVPFTGETMMDVISAIMNSEPPPLQSFAPHLPKELIRIVHKTLKKKRNERYQTTRDLLSDLKDLRDEILLEAKLEQTAVPNKKESETLIIPRLSSSSGSVKDALLLTEFENTTGEAIFDQTLKTALAFSLAQSPFLDVVPDAKVRQTLLRMGCSPDARVTKELGEEICLRQNLKAFLTGTISSFGNIYVLTLEAINARTGENLGREFEQVTSREEILNALGKAATGMREKLGESLSSIEKYCVEVGEATTSSLEALKFYTLGLEQAILGKQFEAIPFLNKALEIDPKFALGYAGLAVIYSNTNQWKLAAKMTVKAFQLRDTVSEIEKLRISYFHYKLVTSEIDKAIDTLELWRKTYPLSVAPFIGLSDSLERIGQSEKAVSVILEGLRLETATALVYMNLAESLLSLDRYAEVKEACRQAFEKQFEGDDFHLFLYIVAFIENDETAMTENLNWFSGRKNEYLAFDLQAGSAAFQGKWRTTQDFSRKAIDLATRGNANEVAAKFAAEQALRIVFWSSGTDLPKTDDNQLKTVLKSQTNKALNLERGKEVIIRTALALAVAGYSAEANELAEELKAERPKDTLFNNLWHPTINAALQLQKDNPKEAIEELEIVERYEKAGEFYPQYLRGLAYLKMGKTKDAVKEFDKILNHRGEAPLSSIYPLAQLNKARATKDKAEYEKFFEWWKDADKDMPALVEAQKEYNSLKG